MSNDQACERHIFIVMEAVITTLVWAALIQGAILATMYVFSRKYPSRANRLLGLFLCVIVYEGVIQFIPYNYIGDYAIFYFGLPVVKLFYPVLFFHYVLVKLDRQKAWSLFLNIHYILAFGVWGLTLINLILYAFTGQNLAGHIRFEAEENLYMGIQYYAVLAIFFVFINSIREVFRYKRIVQEKYSDSDMLQINWLWGFILVLLPIIIIWTSHLIYIASGHGGSMDFELATWAFVVVFLYFVSYQAYKHKNLFEGVDPPEGPQEKRARRMIGPDAGEVRLDVEQKKMIDQIRNYMEKERPYLDASLSIFQLSRQLKMDVTQLSTLINHSVGQHFFDFVNAYRVKRAQEILEDPDQVRKTVLEILYEVGFNSKSSFNTVFKKFTGQTPTEYRKDHFKMTGS